MSPESRWDNNHYIIIFIWKLRSFEIILISRELALAEMFFFSKLPQCKTLISMFPDKDEALVIIIFDSGTHNLRSIDLGKFLTYDWKVTMVEIQSASNSMSKRNWQIWTLSPGIWLEVIHLETWIVMKTSNQDIWIRGLLISIFVVLFSKTLGQSSILCRVMSNT